MTFSRSENDVHLSDATFLQEFLKIPRHILSNRDIDGLAHVVLHAIGHDSHLGLNRAAYLVNNPDFNRLQGVAGFSKDECRFHDSDVWENPSAFSKRMEKAPFHQKIKTVVRQSFHKNMSPVHHAQLLSQELGMKMSDVHVWDTKQGNHGIFIFEEGARAVCRKIDGLLEQIAALLELCPIQS